VRNRPAPQPDPWPIASAAVAAANSAKPPAHSSFCPARRRANERSRSKVNNSASSAAATGSRELDTAGPERRELLAPIGVTAAPGGTTLT